MLSRSALSRLCIVGAVHGRQTLASCLAVTGTDNLAQQQNISLCDSSATSFTAERTRSRSFPSASRDYELSRFAKEFKFIDYLGRGSYGFVCAALNTVDLQTYAVKCVPFSGQQMPEVLNEVRTMATIPSHTNVIRYFSSWMEHSSSAFHSFIDRCVNDNTAAISESDSCSDSPINFRDVSQVLYIQLEYCHGSLRSWLESRAFIDPPYAMHIFNQMAQGLHHLHNNGLLHLDIKPENCLHHNMQIFKLSDFGSSRPSDLTTTTSSGHFGTESYAAPECKNYSGFQTCSTKSDVYSLGLCLMELFSLFNTAMERALAFDSLRKRSFPENWMKAWPNVAAIIEAMTMPSPEDRPSLQSLLDWSSSMLEPDPNFSLKFSLATEEELEAK